MGQPRIFRLLLLVLIDKYKPHGYELMKILNEISGGLIKVGPGTIYPALFFLKARGFIREISGDRRKKYELTAKGREELEKHIDKLLILCKNLISLIESSRSSATRDKVQRQDTRE